MYRLLVVSWTDVGISQVVIDFGIMKKQALDATEVINHQSLPEKYSNSEFKMRAIKLWKD